MKKHKRIGVLCIVGVVFLVIGGAVFGAGLASGGSLHYLQVNKNTASWWPFSHGSMGIGIDFDDYFDDDFDDDFDFTGSFQSGESYGEDLGEVKSIQINADAGEIELRRGTTNHIEYRTRKKEFVSFTNTDGNLSITIDHNNTYMHNIDEKIVITLSDTLYEEVRIDCDLGDVFVDGIRAKSYDLRLALGDIDLENITSEAFFLDQKCGDIDVQGNLIGKTTISNKLGDTDVELLGNANEYRYSVNNTLGDTSVFGNERDGSASMEGGNTDAKNFISIDNKLGDIDLDIR